MEWPNEGEHWHVCGFVFAVGIASVVDHLHLLCTVRMKHETSALLNGAWIVISC